MKEIAVMSFCSYEGAGCIEWKSGIEHAKINPRKDYAIK